MADNTATQLQGLWERLDPGPLDLAELTSSGRREKRRLRIRRGLLLGVAASVTLSATVMVFEFGESSPASPPASQPATGEPGPLDATPRQVVPGDIITLRFDGTDARGLGYTFVSANGAIRYLLTSDGGNPSNDPSWSAGQAVLFDVGIGGTAPERLIVPPEAAPGNYRLCSFNSAVRRCTDITVTES